MKRILMTGWLLAGGCWVSGGASAGGEDSPAAEVEMDTMVVSPTRSEQPVSQTAPAITVITGEELVRKQVTTVADALREVPGVQVLESGSRGSLTSIFIRGADADQVLVLIDGVRVNSTTLGLFDFASLTPENIDRIEVMRGFGGTLYGSEAIGGVIQIFTRRGSGPPRGSVAVSGGNGGTDREVGEVSGQVGIVSFSGAASHLHTDGFKPENDDYENTTASGRLDADLVDNGSARVSFQLSDSEFGNFASNNFLAASDPNARQEDQIAVTRAEWKHALSRALRYRLGFSFARQDQQFVDPPDVAETSSTTSDFLSKIYTGDALATATWLDGHVESTVGLEWELQAGEAQSITRDPMFGDFASDFDHDVRNVAGFTLHQLFFDEGRLVVSGGVRVDDNQRFGRAVSPSGGVSYLLPAETRLRGTYAEGFKAPSLNELFFPGFGNPDLGAERSWEVDVGFDQPLVSDRAKVIFDYFHRRVTNLIAGVPQQSGLFLAQNVGDSTVDGAEIAIDAEVISGVHAGGEYTFLDVDASENGRARRPRHSGSLHVSAERSGVWRSGDLAIVEARLLLVGERVDFDPLMSFAARDNPAYQRADLATAYSWPCVIPYVQRMKVFGRIENLFDRHYQEVLGFGARPATFLAGVGAEF